MPTKWTVAAPKPPKKPTGRHANAKKNSAAHSKYHSDMHEYYKHKEDYHHAQSRFAEGKAQKANLQAKKQQDAFWKMVQKKK
jgi:hypothetical protein